jgi:SPP1 gp7 family putative phage head morphogenesis protein
MVDKNIVKRAIENQISGMPISERVKKNLISNISEVRVAITQGLVQGESYQKIVKRVRGVQEKHAYQAKRIVQTESHRVQNEARYDSITHAENLGIEVKKRWMSAGDGVVRDTHISLDGKYADKDGFFYSGGGQAQYPGGFGIASEDINCRCTVVTEVEPIGKTPIVDKKAWAEEKGIDYKEFRKIT